ncbi:polysaccharide deacetylase family protein [Microbacterium sp. 22242]|uniref:polysaccharide deacetylase family protein n=1 Tax=Microbacterium sp. 22242 TaxID=3453896 RepID=UPI003F85C27C
MNPSVGRDLLGYGKNPPRVEWPGSARLAVNIAINYEEGTEGSPLMGDEVRDERAWVPSKLPAHERDLLQEAEFEYGSRVGMWRLLRLLQDRGMKFSAFVSAQALELHPELTRVLAEADCDFVGHSYRSVARLAKTPDDEREDIRRVRETVRRLTGKEVRGSFPRPPITVHTRRILAEEGLLYDSGTTNDDLPYYAPVDGRPMLVLPYATDTNDARFWGGSSGPGFSTGAQFFEYLRDAFDLLYEESATTPRMMSVGIHPRIMRPGRAMGLVRFLDYIQSFDDVWIARRDEIAHCFAGQFAPDDAWNWSPAESHLS